MENEGQCWKQDTGTPLDLRPFPVWNGPIASIDRESASRVNSCPAYSSGDIANIAEVLNLWRSQPLHSVCIPARLCVKVRLASWLN